MKHKTRQSTYGQNSSTKIKSLTREVTFCRTILTVRQILVDLQSYIELGSTQNTVYHISLGDVPMHQRRALSVLIPTSSSA